MLVVGWRGVGIYVGNGSQLESLCGFGGDGVGGGDEIVNFLRLIGGNSPTDEGSYIAKR